MSSDDTRGRRSIRLQAFDYSSEGAYFLTICTDRHRCLFGKVVDEEVEISRLGQSLRNEWSIVPGLRPGVTLDNYVVMPNHFHAIVFIGEPHTGAHRVVPNPQEPTDSRVGAHGNAPCFRQPKSISTLVSGFKGSVTRTARRITNDPDFVVWQRNYYEHVIRNEADLTEKRQYIENNPLKWELDKYFRSL